MEKNLVWLSVLALTLGAEAEVNFSPSEALWYAQPAVVKEDSVPWASGLSPSRNYGVLPKGASAEKGDWYAPPNQQALRARDPWESQTLPVGNGRVGGTVFGGDCRDRVNLNEISLWSGGPNLPGNGVGYSYGPLSKASEFGSYQPFGNLYAEYDLKDKTTWYARSLDLKTAIAATEFVNGGVKHTREVFVSRPDDVLVYSAKVDKPGALSVKLALTPYHSLDFSVEKDVIVMRGKLENGELFEGRLYVRAKGGKCAVVGGAASVKMGYTGKGDMLRPEFDASGIPYFRITNADAVEAYVTLATNYKEDFAANWIGDDPAKRNQKVLSQVRGKSLGSIRSAHLADYQSLYNRLSINLGKTRASIAKLPTDQRIIKYREELEDVELEALVYQYGRYVLIAGSRPGNLPLTLQGIWNDKVHAAWACDYHNNINLQMCYWGAEVANLSECHQTFFDFIRAMEEPLKEMTRKQFGADKKGWTTRISQNPWGGGGWIKWNPPVNAWYALHLWDHYQYSLDKQYLKEVGYPAMKEICEFWETMLKEVGEHGEGLRSDGGKRPLTVAEHPELVCIKKGSLVAPNGWSHEWGPVEDGCMHDQQLIWELFDNTAKAAAVLGVDGSWAKELINKRNRLVSNRISEQGYLQEWIVDRPFMVSGHRHTSHLIGVFPGSMLWNAPDSANLIKAAEKALDLRGLSGDNRRSWTWPWRTALWARFHRPRLARQMVQSYIRWNVLDNLFGNHPPMQMDGTYGMTGGMSEILVQSHTDKIELLPALPYLWHTGSVKGIRARGNVTIDMTWKNRQLTSCDLWTTERNPKPVTILYHGQTKEVVPTYRKEK